MNKIIRTLFFCKGRGRRVQCNTEWSYRHIFIKVYLLYPKIIGINRSTFNGEMMPLGGTKQVHGDIFSCVSLLGIEMFFCFLKISFRIISTLFTKRHSSVLLSSSSVSPVTSVLNRANVYILSENIWQIYTQRHRLDCMCKCKMPSEVYTNHTHRTCHANNQPLSSL